MTNARVCAQNVRSQLVLMGKLVAHSSSVVATIRAPIVVSVPQSLGGAGV